MSTPIEPDLLQYIPETLRACPALRNRYSVMRHGQAWSNINGILTSGGLGLTEDGRVAVQRAALALPHADWRIYCSTSPRGAETGMLVRETRGIEAKVAFDTRLRERDWGDHEGKPEANCFEIYAQDEFDPTARPASAEFEAKMILRLSSLVIDIEQNHDNCNILLVSHCDPIQVLQMIFSGKRVNHYIRMPQLACAEIKPLYFQPRTVQATKKPDCSGSLVDLLPKAGEFPRGGEPAPA